MSTDDKILQEDLSIMTTRVVLLKASGDDQSSLVSSELSHPCVVVARDRNGHELSGITVVFAVSAGGGTLSRASVTTGSNGRASSTLTLGSTAGINEVTARATGITTPVPVYFTATGTAEDIRSQM